MKKYYVELNNETCIISEIEDVVIHDEHGVRTVKLRTVIESGGLNIMSNLGFYPVKAGTTERVEYNSGYIFASEVKRVDFKFDVKYHADVVWYEFDPALEIASDEDEARLREEFERAGYAFDVYIGADGKKHAKITKG